MNDRFDNKHHDDSQSEVSSPGIFARLKRRWTAVRNADKNELLSEIIARALVGLGIGAVLCFLLIPVIFWPSKHNPRPMFDEISDTSWAKWLFGCVLLVPPAIGTLSALIDDPRVGFWRSLGFDRRTRRRYELSDGYMLVEEDDSEKSLLAKILSVIGHVVGWTLICAPGLLLILYGRHVIQTEKFIEGRSSHAIYGLGAVGFGWILVGIGIGFLIDMVGDFLERSVLKFLGWVLGGAVVLYGISILCKSAL
jgi:hypothetical protein